MNKVHWNSVKSRGKCAGRIAAEMLEKSYRLVRGGFSKKETVVKRVRKEKRKIAI